MAELVTAIITTYKRNPEIIERALKSVICQTYENIEIIVVDDSPSDYPLRSAVADVVRRYGDLGVIYIQHEKSKGACAARNTGLDVSKGVYVAFLDDDDEWLPTKIQRQVEQIAGGQFALVYCNNMVKNDTTGSLIENKHAIYTGAVYKTLIRYNFIGSTSFPLIVTKALRSIGGFDIYMESAQDYDVWLRLAEKYQITCVEEPLVIYHVHDGDQITKNRNKQINGFERINQKNMRYLNTDREAYWFRLKVLIPVYAVNRQYNEAFRAWWKSVILCPNKVAVNIKYFLTIIKHLLN